MVSRPIGSLVLSCVLVLTITCAGREEEEEAQVEEAQVEEAQVEVALPDTTAGSVWAYLEEVDYRQNWHLWPEKGELYPGTEPHGMLLTTYMNDVAREALTNKTGSFPAGAVIVKENYMPDSTLAAVTIMYKVEGYNADHNDWHWVKRLVDGTVAAEGRVEGCQNCHGGVQANDYIFTASLSN